MEKLQITNLRPRFERRSRHSITLLAVDESRPETKLGIFQKQISKSFSMGNFDSQTGIS
jgi:hypothetical protein